MTKPIINQIHRLLIKDEKTIAIAESCTGGLVSSLLTSLSGSSQYFILGVIVYSNKTKINLLRIPQKLIAKKGAVSEEVALRMAVSVKKIAKADLGIGITGIAGPTGATMLKPVGTVFIAISSKNKTICRKFNFLGNRNTVRKTSSLKALELLKLFL